MAQINWAETIWLLGPELILTVGALVVLVLDFVREDDRGPLLPGLTLIALGGAFLLSFMYLGLDRTALFMFEVDNLTTFFRLLATGTSVLILLVSVDYVRSRSRHAGEFYSLLLWVTLAVILVAASSDLILLYLSFELLSITSYILVGWLRDEARSNEAAMKYLLYGAISSAVMLYGMSLLYGAAGSTRLEDIARTFSNPAVQVGTLDELVLPAVVLMLAGFGFKTSLVPFHQWAPDAYEGAPTPVTAFLSVGSKAAGFAVLIRVLLMALPMFQVDWAAVLVAFSILTMTLGNLVALVQTNMKRLLAYSSVAQAGYILMGLAAYVATDTSTLNGVAGVLLYLVAYLFTNLGAFIAVIAYEQATGSVAIADYAGMVRRAPWLAAALVVFFLSLAGIPPTAGFVGKLAVFGAAINAQLYYLAIIGVLNSVISVYYYFNVVRQMFFMPPPAEGDGRISYPQAMGLALTVSLVGTLLIGIYPQPFLDLANLGRQFLAMLPLA
ncbi:MAG: NADH-quinone oxidoreductase subunit N [Ardenticatenia bacterium]|nr:NADH-quinone oxidoreductase subunit N [Ardenticatenia bacterium]